MALRPIKKSIEIQAPEDKIWRVLFTSDYIPEWYTAFGDGIKADTDWQQGSKAAFTDNKGNGMLGKIAKHEPNKLLVIEYEGFLVNGKEDFESAGAREARGAQEIYQLQKSANGNLLSISCEMDENYFGFMSAAWEIALQKIKELSELHS